MIGFEETVLKIVYPLFEKIGLLWQTGAINPAQEHFVSHLVRQKIIVAIDSVIPSENPDPKHFLLFLPEGELHELGLLFYNYLLRKRGHKVTYLGQWVPMKEMAEAVTVLNMDYLLTSIITVHSDADLMDYLDRLSSSFNAKTVFVSGYKAGNLEGKLPKNIIRISKIDDLFDNLT